MYSMMEDNSDTIRSTKFKKLTQAICGLVSEAMSLMVSGCGSEFVTRLLLCVFRLMTTAWSDSSLLTAQMRKVLTLCYSTLTSPYSMEKTWSSRSQRWRNKQKHDTVYHMFWINYKYWHFSFSFRSWMKSLPTWIMMRYFKTKVAAEKWCGSRKNNHLRLIMSEDSVCYPKRRVTHLPGHREMCAEKHCELSVCHMFRGFSVYILFSASICVIVSGQCLNSY